MMIGNYLTDDKSSLTAFKGYWALLHFGSINFCPFPSSSGHSKFVQPSLGTQGLESFVFFKIQNWGSVTHYFKPLLFQALLFCEATANRDTRSPLCSPAVMGTAAQAAQGLWPLVTTEADSLSLLQHQTGTSLTGGWGENSNLKTWRGWSH